MESQMNAVWMSKLFTVDGSVDVSVDLLSVNFCFKQFLFTFNRADTLACAFD